MRKEIYSNEYRNIIQKLKNTRAELGFSQIEVARKMNRPQSYISKIENGDQKIGILELKELTKVYKKDINYFL